jgi:hypothetical protein
MTDKNMRHGRKTLLRLSRQPWRPLGGVKGWFGSVRPGFGVGDHAKRKIKTLAG